MTVAFVYSRAFERFDYGPGHPMRIERLPLTVALMKAYGLLDHPDLRWIKAEPASEAELLSFHDPAYLAALRQADKEGFRPGLMVFGLGPGDNPVFPGMWDWSRLLAGATLQACRVVAQGEAEISFNISGGMHHGRPRRAHGFCYVNDLVIAIHELVARGLKVAYVDIDVHHGDGVQQAFYDSDRVLTISLHQSGLTLFPGTGRAREQGEGAARGWAVNLPFLPYTDSQVYLWAFDQIVPPLLKAFEPAFLVTQLGVDGLCSDPLANLCLTEEVVVHVCRFFKGLGIPWAATGGGGYDVVNPARCWALALAQMLGQELDNELPSDFLLIIKELEPERRRLRDGPCLVNDSARSRARAEAERVVGVIKSQVFPIHGL